MGIVIGFEDEVLEDGTMPEVAEEKKQEIVTKAKQVLVKIPEKRIPEILEGYDCVVVNTFPNDDYHTTDEERERNNIFAKDAQKIRKMKRIYRRLDEYVIAVREHLKFLDKVAEQNGVYDKEKFKKLFFKGKIDIVGMRFPKYKGPNRKDINYKYLSEFILSDADPQEILPKWQRDDFEEEVDWEEELHRLYSDEELERILAPLDEETRRYENEVFIKGEDDQDGHNIAVALSTKESKKLMKLMPELSVKLKEMKREQRTLDRLNDAFIHSTISEDLSELSKYDSNYGYVSKAEVPEFVGDVFSSKDYNKYIRKLEEFEDNNVSSLYHGKDKTLGEIKELELKEMLEQEGWNIRNFYDNRAKEKKMKQLRKKDIKKEKQLKKHLMEIQKRRDHYTSSEEFKEYSKKKDKKKKFKDKKLHKDKKELKSNIKKDFTEILMGAVGAKEQTFKEYEERALDLTNLFPGGDE